MVTVVQPALDHAAKVGHQPSPDQLTAAHLKHTALHKLGFKPGFRIRIRIRRIRMFLACPDPDPHKFADPDPGKKVRK